MKIIKKVYKKEIEYVLVPEIYYRPYIEKYKEGTNQDHQALFREVEKINWEMLQDLYRLLMKKNRTFSDNRDINVLARDIISFSYENYLEELSLHVLYLMRKYNQDSFVNFVLTVSEKDRYFSEIMDRVSKYAVLYTERKE